MKQLSKFQTTLFVLGGALMVIGVGCYVFMLQQLVVCWVFLLGAVLFATMQLLQVYEGHELTVRRLKRIMNLADILFVVSGILLADTAYANAGHSFFAQLFTNRETYISLLYNKWVVLLLIAAVLEVYTMHRIDHELSKKNIKE
jgi:uncharacterized membrane protein